MRKERIVSWSLRVLCAVILLQTLFFKFGGAEESRRIFSALGVEPWGRIVVGLFELVAAVLLFLPSMTWLGALFSAVLMAGAIFAHVTVLGVALQNVVKGGDGGLLFSLAVVVFFASLALFVLEWKEGRPKVFVEEHLLKR
ncbi:DoxX family membrane protein [Candidatus Woesearchaeota archaeon]|nr:MAG: DoxX family membrane protein [Candidatus Woesearchaeota archaeon]